MSSKPKQMIPKIIFLTIILFALRVLAQLTEFFVDLPWVPDFEEWHSASVAYWRLLTAQILILTFMILAYRKLNVRNVQYSKTRGYIYVIWGAVYLLAMVTRHILGLTIYSDTVWFTSFLSIYFHYVLATFLLAVGTAHLKGAK